MACREAATAGGASLVILDWVGFIPKLHNAPGALLVLSLLFGVGPVVFKLLAVAIVWRYPLTASRQAEVRREIVAQRSA